VSPTRMLRHGRTHIPLPGLVAAVACALLLLIGGAFASRAQGAVGEFQPLTSSPVRLTSLAVNPHTNLIYAQQNGGTSFYSYDPRSDAWTELAAAPTNSGNNGGATYLNGKIYVSYTENSSQVDVYDISSNTWTTIANPLGEGTADITALGEDIYMAVETKFIKYNPATETTTTLAEPPKFTTTECGSGFEAWGGLQPYHGKIYGDQGNGCKGFAVYDVASNSWSELPELPNGAVAGSALDPVTGTYYAYGNYHQTELFRYDIASNSWSVATLPFKIGDGGLGYVSLAGLRGIYLIQGEDGMGFTRYTTAEPVADLSLTQAASVGSTKVGQQVTYTIGAANGGPNEVANVTVADSLPSDVTLVSSSATQGSCSGTSAVSCNLGTLAKGGSAIVTITVTAAAVGTATNTASVSGEAVDPNTANNSATTSVAIASATPPLLPARWLVPHGTLRLARGAKWVSDPLLNLNPQLSLTGTAQLVIYQGPGAQGMPTVLATNTVFLAAGATKTLYLHLNATALAKLRRSHQLRVQILLSLVDPFGRSVKPTGVYLLTRPAGHHRRKKTKR
jgi:uncharacterized repeat protein (TIGR01451 family)